jgi:MFS family permease
VNPFTEISRSFKAIGSGPRRFLLFLVFNVFSWQCLVGTVMVLYARALGINSAWVGILSSVLPFTMAVSLVMKPAAEKMGSKRLMLLGWTGRNIVVMPILLIPWVYGRWGTEGALLLLFSTVILFCLSRSLSVVAWLPWIHEIVPENQRGTFISLQMLVIRGVGIVFGPMIFFFFGRDVSPALWKFAAVNLFGIICGFVSIPLMIRIPGGEPFPAQTNNTSSHIEDYRAVFRDRQFRNFMIWAALGTGVSFGQVMLMALYMRDFLGISDGLNVFTVSIGGLAAALTVQRWGAVADSHGSPTTMAAASGLAAVALALISAVSPGGWAVYMMIPLYAVLTLATAGFFVASRRGLLHRTKDHLRNAYSAVWLTCTTFCAGISFIIIGMFLKQNTDTMYILTCLGYALFAGIISIGCVYLPESGIDYAENTYELFDPSRPFFSLMRMCSYVLTPTVKTSNDKNEIAK